MKLPESFLKQMYDILNEEYDDFSEALDQDSSTSIRMNLAKPVMDWKELYAGEEIPWCKHGVVLNQRPSFTLDPKFHAGQYYVQEASSMVIYSVVSEIIESLKEPVVLDLCASPGGKSTAILDAMKGNGTLVCNEVIQSRVGPLIHNIMKWGYANAIVTNNDAAVFGKELQGEFDVLVVDAPCSGEGMFRKDRNAISEWSMDHVDHCSVRQQRILKDSINCLKENGYLIYSTCTYNEKENMNNVLWMEEEFQLESCVLSSFEHKAITTVNKGGSIGYQFYPHKTIGEGFFISVLRKKSTLHKSSAPNKGGLLDLSNDMYKVLSEWIGNHSDFRFGLSKSNDVFMYNKSTYEMVQRLLSKFRIRHSGIRAGQFKKLIFIPHHNLALGNNVDFACNIIELETENALSFLRKEMHKIDGPKGWNLVTHDGFGLGWIKNIGNRINNYLPKEFRVLK